MVQEKPRQGMLIETGWTRLYRVAGIGILIAVTLMLLDIALSFTGGDVPVGGLTAVDWFKHLNDHPFIGLRNLGLFNVINPFLLLPLYLAVYQIHRKSCPAYAALALILWLLGVAIYAANNRALSMLALSQQYVAAAGEAQKSLLATAGTVILAQAEDFTPGAFVGFFVQSAASLMMFGVMLQGQVFNRRVTLLGLVGSSFLLIFIISATFVPSSFNLVMILALAGGLMMLAWNILMALVMFRMGRNPHKDEARKIARSDTAEKELSVP